MIGRALVTGADGFIGSHLTERLVARGYEVRAFVFYNSFERWGWLDEVPSAVRDAVEVISGDVRDPHGVRKAVAGCDVVLHLAALIGIPFSYGSPASYVDTNITGTLNVLQAARDEGARVVHTSTSEVYGTAQVVPITEDHPLQAQSPYSATKIGADQMALAFQRSFGLPVTVVRPFNTYGPRQSTRAVIPTIITQIARGVPVLRLGALDPTRDFNYVTDTADGFIAALECDGADGEVVNLGTGSEFSIGTTVELIAELMETSVEVEVEDERLRPEGSEVDRLLADNAKAHRLFGWTPLFSGLEGFRRGLTLTIDWFSDPENLSLYRRTGYSV